jgi:hypothetical protein
LFQYLAYVCIIIALVSVISYDAFPYSSSLDFDEIPSLILGDSRIIRRNVVDPYGLNSILTRLTHRSGLEDIPRKRTIDLIEKDENDFI